MLVALYFFFPPPASHCRQTPPTALVSLCVDWRTAVCALGVAQGMRECVPGGGGVCECVCVVALYIDSFLSPFGQRPAATLRTTRARTSWWWRTTSSWPRSWRSRASCLTSRPLCSTPAPLTPATASRFAVRTLGLLRVSLSLTAAKRDDPSLTCALARRVCLPGMSSCAWARTCPTTSSAGASRRRSPATAAPSSTRAAPPATPRRVLAVPRCVHERTRACVHSCVFVFLRKHPLTCRV
jgi:hypothetical protein